jgi:hypothetical protein
MDSNHQYGFPRHAVAIRSGLSRTSDALASLKLGAIVIGYRFAGTACTTIRPRKLAEFPRLCRPSTFPWVTGAVGRLRARNW